MLTVVKQIGKEKTGYVGDAADDTDMERGMLHKISCSHLKLLTNHTERARSWLEEVAQIEESLMLGGIELRLGRLERFVQVQSLDWVYTAWTEMALISWRICHCTKNVGNLRKNQLQLIGVAS